MRIEEKKNTMKDGTIACKNETDRLPSIVFLDCSTKGTCMEKTIDEQ